MATPVFCCGFECGNSGAVHWNLSSASIVTASPIDDLRSLQINVSGGAATASVNVLLSAQTAVWRVVLKFTTLPTTSVPLLVDAVGNEGAYFNASDGKVYAGFATGSLGATGVAISTGTRVVIDVKVVGTANPHTIDVTVNGTACGQSSHAIAAANIGQPTIGSGSAFTANYLADSFIWSQTAADYPLGDGKVLGFVPASDGTHTATSTHIVKGTAATPVGAAITSATTDSFNWVNARPLLGGATDNTRLINQQTAASTEYVEHGIEQTTEANGPRGIEVVVAYDAAGTQAATASYKISDNGTEDVVKSLTAGVSADTFARKHYATMPGGGGAWTLARFKALDLRFGYSSDATPDMYLRGWIVEAEFAASTSDVTLALTGVAATTAAGSLAVSHDQALTGTSATSAAGTLTPSPSLALTGSTATTAAGTLAPATTIAITGVAATTATGILTATGGSGGDVTLALTGIAATTSVGSLAPSTSIALTGAAATTAEGALTPQNTHALTGATATSSVGSLTPTTTLALSGVAVTSTAGTVSPQNTHALTGVAATTATGTLTASIGGNVTVALTGIGATATAGSLTPSTTASIQGVAATTSIGTLAPATTVSLSGATATTAAGAITAQISAAFVMGRIAVADRRLGTVAVRDARAGSVIAASVALGKVYASDSHAGRAKVADASLGRISVADRPV